MGSLNLFQSWKARKKILTKFRDSGAYTAELARSLKDLDLRSSPYLNQFIRHKVIVNNGSDGYYLDERALMQYRMNRTKWGMVILMLILIFFAMVIFKK